MNSKEKQTLRDGIASLRQRLQELENSTSLIPARRATDGLSIREIVSTSLDGFWVNDQEGRFIDVNQAYCEMIGYSRDELLQMRISDVEALEKSSDVKQRINMLEQAGNACFESKHRRKDGSLLEVEISVTYSTVESGRFVAFLRDISERKKAAAILQARLQLSEMSHKVSEESLLQHTLDIAEQLTDSRIGFFYYVDHDHTTLSLQTWSTNTLNNYGALPGKSAHYPLAEAGIWANCVRQGRPVIDNRSQSKPLAPGLPEGLPVLDLELIVPVKDGNKVVAIIGVGNKPIDYSEADVKTVSTLAQLAWDIIQRQRAEAEIRAANQQLAATNQQLRATEQQLRSSNVLLARKMEQLAEAQEIAQLGNWEYDPIKNGFSCSDELLRISGLTLADAPSSLAAFRQLIHPDDAAAVALAFRDAQNWQQDSYSAEYRLVRSDGEIRFVREHCRYKRNQQDEVIRSLGTVLDITEQKVTADALHKSQELFSAVLNSIPVRVFWKDTNLKFLGCNQPLVKDAGYRSVADIIGKDDFAFSWSQYAERYQADDRAVLASGNAKLLFEEPLITATGEILHLLTSKVPLRDIDGTIIGILGTYLDITSLKRAEETEKKLEAQLQQAQKMESIGRLAGGVAHDFNNMLGVIIGYTELAMDEIGPNDPLHHHFKEILTAAERSTDVARQLLAFARRQSIHPKIIDLNETVSGMLKMLRRLIGEDIELEWLPDQELWAVKIDPVQIDQVLANLCVNARDAIGDSGKISVQTENISIKPDSCDQIPDCQLGDYVRLTVSDNGCGMDAATLDRLFEPFFTTKEVGKGTGLGLATIYGIAKQNNGFILVNSSPGQGTTFMIHFPRQLDLQEAQPQQETATELEGGGQRVLLVEDEPSILNMTELMLQRLGYQVLAVNNPVTAVELCRENPDAIDLLISDVVMPDMNGRQLADELHKLNPTMKVLFISGYTADVIIRSGILESSAAFIQKPFTKQALAEKVLEVFQSTT